MICRPRNDPLSSCHCVSPGSDASDGTDDPIHQLTIIVISQWWVTRRGRVRAVLGRRRGAWPAIEPLYGHAAPGQDSRHAAYCASIQVLDPASLTATFENETRSG